MNTRIVKITDKIIERSKESRKIYLEEMELAIAFGVNRSALGCGNLAHAFAGCGSTDKSALSEDTAVNIAVVTAYNDMLSAHKPYESYPEKLRKYANDNNAVVQVAGGVPAMCDGVTQGQSGMELSLLSRDVIALSAAIALSHNMFDATICLGICDKIVPGLLIGTLKFGALPTLFMPGGPMKTGISNVEKAEIRQQFAKGEITREELLVGESNSYHSPGTCTFYGTANTNQMLMEIMGLQLPGSSFVNPDTELRDMLNAHAVKVIVGNAKEPKGRRLFEIIDEKSIVNGIVGLLATGGSTNHTIHIVAIARAAGIIINWDDFSELSEVVPSIARVYPNGAADVNHFHAAGGMSFVMSTLLKNGLLHEDVNTIIGRGLNLFLNEPQIRDGKLTWGKGIDKSLNESIIRPADNPFSKEGGLLVIDGNIGRAVVKTSAIENKEVSFNAPVIVFDEQEDLIIAFKNNELNKDFIAVLPFQGPNANGMPELHKLTPTLTILLKQGFQVALITDGRMSGASGKVPAAIHLTPEANDGGILSKIRTGDIISFNLKDKTIELVDFEEVNSRESRELLRKGSGMGRELFGNLRAGLSGSEVGASFLF
jgi:phosphogluconate dehydratase